MQRTCESIALLKMKHKQRTVPRVAKTLLFTGFRSRHDLQLFEKRVNTSISCVHRGKKSIQKGRNAVKASVRLLHPASGRMERIGESIAGSKIERKQRTECCNLQHFALSDGKNPRK